MDSFERHVGGRNPKLGDGLRWVYICTSVCEHPWHTGLGGWGWAGMQTMSCLSEASSSPRTH